jgi:hypothetical protein
VKSLETWVLVCAVLAAVASIVVVTTLQGRAMASRDAQVTLEQVRSEVDALQSLPYESSQRRRRSGRVSGSGC